MKIPGYVWYGSDSSWCSWHASSRARIVQDNMFYL